MASSGSVSTNSYSNRNLIFSWTEKSQDEDNLTTTISYTLKGGGSASSWYETGPVKLYIDGDLVYHFKQSGENAWENDGQNTEGRIQLDSGTVVKSGTKTIKHNADGTKSFKVEIEAAIYVWSINCTAEKTFTLNPIDAIKEFNITLDGNGGTIYDHDEDVAASKLTFIKIEGEPFVIPDYNVTYDEGMDDTVDEETGEVNSEPASPTRTFLGYSTNKNATTAEYKVGDTYTKDADVTLYAVYKGNTYTVTFVDGYSNNPVIKTYENVPHGGSVTPPPDPTRKGYTFAGWLGDYSYVISDRKITAFWGCTPIWIMTKNGWQRYEPEE